MHDRALELKVGLVLLTALVILGAFVLFLGDLRFDQGITINVDYGFSGSIQEGAPVKISGVKVGRVSKLVFMGGEPNAAGEPIHVRLVLSVEERARPVLEDKTQFFVNTQGLLGENYVEIVPPRTKGAPLADGAIVRGVDPARFDLLIARLYDFLQAVSDIMQDNRTVFLDLLRAGSSLATTLDSTLKTNEQDLGKAIKNVAVVTERGIQIVDAMQVALGDGKKVAATIDGADQTVTVLKQQLPEVMTKLQRALDEVNRLTGTLGDVDRKRVNGAIDDATHALADARTLLADASAITKRVKGGQGTIGLLIRDDEVYDDLKELLRDLKQHPWKLIWKD